MDVDVSEQSLFPRASAHAPAGDGQLASAMGKKKAKEIVRRVMGNEVPVPIMLQELAAVSPVVVEEMVQALRECRKGQVPTKVQRMNVAEEELCHTLYQLRSALVLLAYVEMIVAGQKVWEMVESRSMVNLLHSRLVDELGLVRRKC